MIGGFLPFDVHELEETHKIGEDQRAAIGVLLRDDCMDDLQEFGDGMEVSCRSRKRRLEILDWEGIIFIQRIAVGGLQDGPAEVTGERHA